MKNLKEKIIKKVKELGWKINIVEELETMDVDFYKKSPAGEDFSFTVQLDDIYDLPNEVFNYYLSFDPEEHAENWVIAKRNGVSGVPSIKELITDAEAIEDMLDELSNTLVDLQNKERRI